MAVHIKVISQTQNDDFYAIVTARKLLEALKHEFQPVEFTHDNQRVIVSKDSNTTDIMEILKLQRRIVELEKAQQKQP